MIHVQAISTSTVVTMVKYISLAPVFSSESMSMGSSDSPPSPLYKSVNFKRCSARIIKFKTKRGCKIPVLPSLDKVIAGPRCGSNGLFLAKKAHRLNRLRVVATPLSSCRPSYTASLSTDN